MKINEVESMVGITKKNIRYYESEGLLHPDRKENGYREYSDEDVQELKKIKLLRKIGIPIEEILRIQSGKLQLEDALNRHIIFLDREMKRTEQIQTFCKYIVNREEQYQTLDPNEHFEQMDEMEKGGMHFMNVTATDKKRKLLPTIMASLVVLLVLCGTLGFIFYAVMADKAPIGVLIILGLFILAVITSILYVMIQRINEIRKGEQYEASKY